MLHTQAPRNLTDWSGVSVGGRSGDNFGFNPVDPIDETIQRPMLMDGTMTFTAVMVKANHCACAISGANEVGHGVAGDRLYGKVMSLIYGADGTTIVGVMVQRHGIVELGSVATVPAVGDMVMCGDNGLIDIADGVPAADGIIADGWQDGATANTFALPKGRVIAVNDTDDRALVDLDG